MAQMMPQGDQSDHDWDPYSRTCRRCNAFKPYFHGGLVGKECRGHRFNRKRVCEQCGMTQKDAADLKVANVCPAMDARADDTIADERAKRENEKVRQAIVDKYTADVKGGRFDHSPGFSKCTVCGEDLDIMPNVNAGGQKVPVCSRKLEKYIDDLKSSGKPVPMSAESNLVYIRQRKDEVRQWPRSYIPTMSSAIGLPGYGLSMTVDGSGPIQSTAPKPPEKPKPFRKIQLDE